MANPFFSGRIPQELFDRAEKHLKSAGISKTQLLAKALEAYLESPDNTDNKVITDGYDQRLADVEQRLQSLESNVIICYHPDNKTSDGWLTTGEAYTEAQQRGYTKSVGTFRRSLSGGSIPVELSQIGLVADFEARNQAKPKDNSVRWLKYGDTK